MKAVSSSALAPAAQAASPPGGRKLNFGCGRKILAGAEGWVNMDVVPLPGVDVVHNMLEPPYPFPEDAFDYILASHVMEHVPQVVQGRDGLLLVTQELHRILKPGGTLEVRGPNPRVGIYYFNNPTHYRVITEWTFDGLVRPDGLEQESCVTYWSEARFREMKVWDDTFTEAPFPSFLRLGRSRMGIFQHLLRRFPVLRPVLGRPAELVIQLTK